MAKKILLVDDDRADIDLAQKVLEKKGYSVVTATNGSEGLDSFKKDNFAAVLLDIQMPTLSGIDLITLLRESSDHKIPIIYITIVPENEVNLEDVEGFVQKPFTEDSLLNEIEKVIN